MRPGRGSITRIPAGLKLGTWLQDLVGDAGHLPARDDDNRSAAQETSSQICLTEVAAGALGFGADQLSPPQMPEGGGSNTVAGQVREPVVTNCQAASKQLTANTLTDAEKAAGWRLLFNGKDFTGWHNFKRKDVRPGWQVKDGLLVCEDPHNAGDIVTDDQFDWFELAARLQHLPCRQQRHHVPRHRRRRPGLGHRPGVPARRQRGGGGPGALRLALRALPAPAGPQDRQTPRRHQTCGPVEPRAPAHQPREVRA